MKNITYTTLLLAGLLFFQTVHAESQQEALLIKANKAYNNANYQAAARIYRRLLVNTPNAFAHRMRLAQSYLFSGRLEAAQQELLVLITTGYDPINVRLLLGDTYMQQAQWAKAKEQFQHVIQQDKENPEAYVRLGNALTELGEKQEADKAFAHYRRLSSK